MKSAFKKILFFEIKGIRHEYQWAAFLLPVFLLCVSFASWKIHPVGQASLLTCDLYHQYAPILAEIRTKILSGDSLFYTWNLGLGTNFWPLLTYNGASPLNIILLFFPQANISDGITLLILIRTGLSGLFFSLLMYKKDGREGAVTLALSTAYALCGYILSYFWVLMWMDAVMLLPLVILGLWKIFCGENARLYVIVLFLIVLSNFYIGFIVCIFLLFFAPVLYFETRDSGLCKSSPTKAGLDFSFYSILAVGMSAVMLIPTVLSLHSTSAALDTLPLTTDVSFKAFDFISRFLLHADPVIREGLPNVYCGVAILLLVPLYLFCSTIPFRQRVISMLLSFFLLVSMSSPFLNFLWHGLHTTNQLPYRQSFLMSFLLLYMASQVLMHTEGLSRQKVYGSGAAVLCYLIFLSTTSEVQNKYWLIYGSAAFNLIYTTIFFGFFGSEKAKKWTGKAFLYAIILEFFFASEFSLAYIEKTEHLSYFPSYGQQAAAIQKEISSSDGTAFARTVLFQPITGTDNDGALYHVKTVSIFASTTSKDFVMFMGALGFANNKEFEVKEEGLTEVSARLLGIRNIVTFTDGTSMQKVTAEGSDSASRSVLGTATSEKDAKADIIYAGNEMTVNEKVLPVGFFVPSAGILTKLDASLSPFEQTNNLFLQMGTQAVYEAGTLTEMSSFNIRQTPDSNIYTIGTDGQSASISFTPRVPFGRTVLLYLGTEQEPIIRITRTDAGTGENKTTVLSPYAGQIIDCGPYVSGENIQLLFTNAEQESFPISCDSIQVTALDTATEKLAAEPLTVTSYDAAHLKGYVDFAADGSLFTSIPYDAGWTVKVDGKQVKTQAAYGALLSVSMAKGHHEISFSYQPPGFILGLFISILLTADFVFLCVWDPIEFISRRRKKKREDLQVIKKEE